MKLKLVSSNDLKKFNQFAVDYFNKKNPLRLVVTSIESIPHNLFSNTPDDYESITDYIQDIMVDECWEIYKKLITIQKRFTKLSLGYLLVDTDTLEVAEIKYEVPEATQLTHKLCWVSNGIKAQRLLTNTQAKNLIEAKQRLSRYHWVRLVAKCLRIQLPSSYMHSVGITILPIETWVKTE